MIELNNYGILVNKLRFLSPKESYECCRLGAIIIDIRKNFEKKYKRPSVNCVDLDPAQINSFFEINSKTDAFIIIDSTGFQSKVIQQSFLEAGFCNIASVAGGILEWQRDELPMTYNNSSFLAKPSFYDENPKNHIKTSLTK